MDNEKGKRLSAGDTAPNFTLLDERGREWCLDQNRGKVVLLLFYPANETLVCTKQLCSLRDNWSKYLDTKAEIVAISSSESESNRAFAEKYRLALPLLSDSGREITRMYASHPLFPVSFMRGLCVIDAEGVIRAHQTMFRAFRPNDHDVILKLYAARADAMEGKRNELRARVRTLLLH